MPAKFHTEDQRITIWKNRRSDDLPESINDWNTSQRAKRAQVGKSGKGRVRLLEYIALPATINPHFRLLLGAAGTGTGTLFKILYVLVEQHPDTIKIVKVYLIDRFSSRSNGIPEIDNMHKDAAMWINQLFALNATTKLKEIEKNNDWAVIHTAAGKVRAARISNNYEAEVKAFKEILGNGEDADDYRPPDLIAYLPKFDYLPNLLEHEKYSDYEPYRQILITAESRRVARTVNNGNPPGPPPPVAPGGSARDPPAFLAPAQQQQPMPNGIVGDLVKACYATNSAVKETSANLDRHASDTKKNLAEHANDTKKNFAELGDKLEQHTSDTKNNLADLGAKLEHHSLDTKKGFAQVNGRVDNVEDNIDDLNGQVTQLQDQVAPIISQLASGDLVIVPRTEVKKKRAAPTFLTQQKTKTRRSSFFSQIDDGRTLNFTDARAAVTDIDDDDDESSNMHTFKYKDDEAAVTDIDENTSVSSSAEDDLSIASNANGLLDTPSAPIRKRRLTNTPEELRLINKQLQAASTPKSAPAKARKRRLSIKPTPSFKNGDFDI